MNILDERNTIKRLIDTGAGIARYGDGEIKVALGRHAVSQEPCPKLARRLKNILTSDFDGCLVGIPRIYDRDDWPTEQKAQFWSRYDRPRVNGLYRRDKVYGSAFITRGDAVPGIDRAFFDLVKTLWLDKDVLVIHGEGRGFLKDVSLMDGARSYSVLVGPPVNAWDRYESLFENAIKTRADVAAISLGPTATVLAYDLCKAGLQSFDLGHMGQFYNKTHSKAGLNDSY